MHSGGRVGAGLRLGSPSPWQVRPARAPWLGLHPAGGHRRVRAPARRLARLGWAAGDRRRSER
eukprot:15091039-Alexandrium_andersonii.AAC.1